jgi:membrane protease YdiL (CAAX protease family)
VLLFFPVLLITGNAIARLLGNDFPEPLYLQMPVSAWLPVMAIKLFTVAILTGGNEEHGWRGVLQPLLQKTTNPLVATLIIGVIWELWHLPLVLNGVYGEGDPAVIVVSRMLSVVPIAFLLAVIYNGSRGSIFLCVLSHACMNSQMGYFGGSQLSHLIGVLIIIVAIVMLRFWRRDAAYVPRH